MSSLVLIGIVVASCVIVGLLSIYFWGANNPVEVACEDVIKQETGMNLNLSPGATPTPPTSAAPSVPTSVPSSAPSSGNKASS